MSKTTALSASICALKFPRLKMNIVCDSTIERLADVWKYRLRNRHRPSESRDFIDNLAHQAKSDLQSVGITEEHLKSIVDSTIAEIELPVVEQEQCAIHTMPWEFVFGVATKPIRKQAPLTITRFLNVKDTATPEKRRVSFSKTNEFHFIGNSPGAFDAIYDFDSEIDFFKDIFNQQVSSQPRSNKGLKKYSSWNFIAHSNTTRDKMKHLLLKNPSIIHFSGVDAHEGADILQKTTNSDGLYFLEPPNGETLLTPGNLGEDLKAGNAQPKLFNVNAYFSGGRIAPALVEHGACASIGLMDTLDNIELELFYTDFYRIWQTSHENCLIAFSLSLQNLRRRIGNKHLAEISLWSRKRLIQSIKAPKNFVEKLTALRSAADNHEASNIIEEIGTATNERTETDRTRSPRTAGDTALQIRIAPFTELNFSLLHNSQPLFRKFYVQALGNATSIRIQTKVNWQIGEKQFAFKMKHIINGEKLDLKNDIKIPLPWGFIPKFSEPIRTLLHVDVLKFNKESGKETIFNKMFEIDLLPADQWKDTDKDGPWLPSFVLPRDPMIPTVIDHAQGYLAALTDEPTIGFDGYQRQRSNSLGYTCPVDLQVRAIWTTLVHRLNVSYINPPPAYSVASQRLRPPSEVFEHRRGTCIDLALLFASCLEWIDVYPVIFLLRNHAFPGYWRTKEGYEEFRSLSHLDYKTPTVSAISPHFSPKLSKFSWVIKFDGYADINNRIRDRVLVPIETVCLTKRTGFKTAVQVATKKLKMDGVMDFEALVDIYTARERKVTPLPTV